MGSAKRYLCVGSGVGEIHEATSKTVLMEALLDLWMEHNGHDKAIEDLTAAELTGFAAEIQRRSDATRSRFVSRKALGLEGR